MNEDVVSFKSGIDQADTRPEAWVERIVVFWLVAAMILTTTSAVATSGEPFQGLHAWASADFATMARTFASEGVWSTKLVPINNNPPFGSEPGAYTHWPPLFPLLLSVVYKVFGESEVSAHVLALSIVLANAFALGSLAALLLGRLAGMIAALCWLLIPVTTTYGRMILHLPLALLFLSLALIGFVKAATNPSFRSRWAILGLVTFALAVFTSWEPVLVVPGLVASAVWNRQAEARKLAIRYLVVGCGAAALVLIVYGLTYPALFENTVQAALYRMGLSRQYEVEILHPNMSGRTAVGPGILVWREFYQIMMGIGLHQLGIALIFVASSWKLIARRSGGLLETVAAGLVSLCVVWYGLMRNHAADHGYETFLFAPWVCLAMGWLTICIVKWTAVENFGRGPHLAACFVLVAPLMPVAGLARGAVQAVGGRSVVKTDDVYRLGEMTRRTTPPGAVVITPEETMVFVYYSGRHVIRAVLSEQRLDRVLTRVRQVFATAPVYLALRRENVADFMSVLRRRQVDTSSEFIIVRLD